MKKYTALLLALVMVLSMSLAGCGKTETPETPEAPQPAATTEPVTPPAEPEPEKPKDAYDDAELHWEDLVGVWYLKTFYYANETPGSVADDDGPGFWDAYEQNTDAHLTFTATDGIDYYWGDKYSVSEEYEDMPHEIVKEPVSEEYDFMSWCVVAENGVYCTYRIGFVDKDTIVCYETFDDADTDYPITYKGIYTKDGPIEFHKSNLEPEYLLGYWYMNSVEVDGDFNYCAETGDDCWIYFGEDGTAEYYEGNIGWPEDASYYPSCEYTVLDEPVLSWMSDDDYPDRQDWSVTVDIPWNEFCEYEYYQFGLTDDYTLTMYHEIMADDGSYHVGVVAEFTMYSPFDYGDGYELVMPPTISDLAMDAADNEWIIVLANDDAVEEEIQEIGWYKDDMSASYDWANLGTLIVAPVDKRVEISIVNGYTLYDSNGNYDDWADGEQVYWSFLYPGEIWYGTADLPEDPDDATLIMYMGFGDEGLEGGEVYSIRLCDFDNSDPYLEF